MAEDLIIVAGDKAGKYQSLVPQLRALVEGEPDLVANLANVAAALKEQFGWLWVGFYLVKPAPAKTSSPALNPYAETEAEKEELVLGPFQGPVACTRIRIGRGVCGSCWAMARTLIVPDVEKFPGHIACSSLSRSEIVVPVIRNDKVVAVLDADSAEYNQFDSMDQQYLEEIVKLVNF